ncbi:undecaprenyl/decaprenyl-phosphate alpha-N-acetylglucosaminyl 1-phosphate transferase [Deinococcus irradiatisoli]|uniref:Undecaprenyl/decaprenyl-phosphate alpha-N-acetylglucosaminyl 1-phosphate transferase n=1 Tax=Deinococcus irradiatisoli TaxID=2202254 RepID=A0A2Z3JFK9_9DEIO|nr:MraY family glycosyltransferase [Deinococcus irradiatisoli]AWN23822.1 undecaprenyl/decaprenyl-phosphate alpha-N-acetylglucosaminyl 1-phosphate transferase [Deinococcus irradiatisoli]
MEQLRTFAQHLGIADLFGRGFWAVLLTFVTAAAITWRFIPQVRAFALRVGWADVPNERRLNTVPLPNAGGLAIFAGFVISIVVGWALRPIIIEQVNIQVLAILLGATLLVLVGFIDDQFGLTPLFRLGAQIVTAALLLVNGLRIDFNAIPFLPVLGGEVANVLSIGLTIVWVVGLTNAMNLLDGVDGVVGGVAFIASTVLLVTAAQFTDRAAAVILLAGLAGAALGYLRHNFNPSRIIMGDAGSTLFGYTLAAVSLLGTLKISVGASLLVPLLIMALPILDTTQVVVGRLARGIRNPLGHPDKTHLHHRVLARTGNARRTSVVLWIAALICGVAGMFAQGIGALTVLLTAAFIGGALWFVAARRMRAQIIEAAQTRRELN